MLCGAWCLFEDVIGVLSDRFQHGDRRALARGLCVWWQHQQQWHLDGQDGQLSQGWQLGQTGNTQVGD